MEAAHYVGKTVKIINIDGQVVEGPCCSYDVYTESAVSVERLHIEQEHYIEVVPIENIVSIEVVLDQNQEEKDIEPICIGMYKEIGGDEYSPIGELLSDFPIPEKAEVLHYLKSAPVVAAAPGIMVDAFTGEHIPGGFLAYYDGVFTWRSDSIYHFEKYNLILPDEFVAHVLKHERNKKPIGK